MLFHCSTQGHWKITLDQLKNNNIFLQQSENFRNSPSSHPKVYGSRKRHKQPQPQSSSCPQTQSPQCWCSPGSSDTHQGSGELWDRALPHPSPGTTMPKSSRDSSAWEHKDFITPMGNITHKIKFKENSCQITSSQALSPPCLSLCDICGNYFLNFMTA